jgi:5-methylcytosine-specific restriction endonuclease McrA
MAPVFRTWGILASHDTRHSRQTRASFNYECCRNKRPYHHSSARQFDRRISLVRQFRANLRNFKRGRARGRAERDAEHSRNPIRRDSRVCFECGPGRPHGTLKCLLSHLISLSKTPANSILKAWPRPTWILGLNLKGLASTAFKAASTFANGTTLPTYLPRLPH